MSTFVRLFSEGGTATIDGIVEFQDESLHTWGSQQIPAGGTIIDQQSLEKASYLVFSAPGYKTASYSRPTVAQYGSFDQELLPKEGYGKYILVGVAAYLLSKFL